MEREGGANPQIITTRTHRMAMPHSSQPISLSERDPGYIAASHEHAVLMLTRLRS